MIRADRSTTTRLELDFGDDNPISESYAAIAGVILDPASQEMLDAVRDHIYSKIDTVVKRSTIPHNDPAWIADPAEEGLFWRGGGGNPDVVIRPLIVTVTWDGERYQYGFRVPQ